MKTRLTWDASAMGSPDLGSKALPSRRTFLRRAALGAGVVAGAATGVVGGVGAAVAQAGGRGLIAFRISNEQWYDERRFAGLLEFFRTSPGTADELAFFTSSTHPPLPLAEVRARAERLAERMPRVRREGMGAGINLLATMGHHEENLDGSLSEPWQRVVDPNGRESRGSFCPGSDELRGYVVEVYTALAQAGPDFLWIDDDVRLAGHMPIGQTCFCAGCLRRFGEESGREFTRESLMAVFRQGDLEERLRWRRRWLVHNRATLGRLFALIESTVHRVRRDLPLGFMTGDRFYEGYDFTRWAQTLAGPEGVDVRWRPGGGFYSDETLSGLTGKAHDIGRQVAQLPASVTVVQSEIENFPYDLLRKAAETTVVEAAVHMGAGTTGTAFNVLSQRPDPLEEYEPLLRRIASVRPFYARLREVLGRHPVVGAWPAWNTDIAVANSVDGSWPEGAGDATGALARCHVLGEIGVPLCYGPVGARLAVLSGPMPLAFDGEELRRLLSGGVLMDAAAWGSLERLGLAGLTGVRLGEVRARDAIEVLTGHPLNGRFAGRSRDCRQSFWKEPAQALEPVARGVEVLARMIDYLGRDLGVAMTAHTNELGGRVVVQGYFPWAQMHHLGKSSQMKSVCRWLSGDRLPGVVESFARVHVWVRERGPGDWAVVVLNASLDPAREVVLRFPGGVRRVRWHGMDGRRTSLRVLSDDGGGAGGADWAGGAACRVRLPRMAAWSVGLVTAGA